MTTREEEPQFTDRVTRGEDGKYRWIYSVNLLKTPVIFWLIWRIFFFIVLGIFAMIILFDTKWGFAGLVNNLKILGYFLIGMTAVIGLSYLIYAAIMGGKYIVEFEMDEKSITHRQIASQAKKAKALGRAALIAGVASGKPGTVAAGIGASQTAMTSEFAKVKRVKANQRFHLIKVNATLDHNQIYVPDEDFDFVHNFILSHCPNLKW